LKIDLCGYEEHNKEGINKGEEIFKLKAFFIAEGKRKYS
jgi:hypothetical protein